MNSRLNIIELTKRRFHDDVFSLLNMKANGQYAVMVLDQRAAKIMGSALSLTDIMDKYDIAMLESLEKIRQPVPDIPAIYFVEPTIQSIQSIVNDFSDVKRGPMYKAALLCFTRSIPPEGATLIKNCSALRMRVLCVVEVQLDYLPIETNVISLGITNSLDIYHLKEKELRTKIDTITARLVTLFASSNERPYVRATSPPTTSASASTSSSLASQLGVAVSTALDQYIDNNTHSHWYWGDGNLVDEKRGPHGDSRRRSILLVVDRSTDVLASVLHEFTYQAMLHDLVGHTHSQDFGKTMTYEDAKGVERNLRVSNLGQQEDVFWERSKSLHISQVSLFLHDAIESYASSNTMAVARGNSNSGNESGRAMSNKELAAVMQTMPEFKAMWAKHSGHSHFALLLSKMFGDMNLCDISKAEMTFVTGVTDDAKKIKYKEEWKLLLTTMEDMVEKLKIEQKIEDDNENTIEENESPWSGMSSIKKNKPIKKQHSKTKEIMCNIVRLVVIFCAAHQGIEDDEYKRLKKIIGNDDVMMNVEQNLTSFNLTCYRTKTRTTRDSNQINNAIKEAKTNTMVTRKRKPLVATLLASMLNTTTEEKGMIWVRKDDQPLEEKTMRRRIPRSTRKQYTPRNVAVNQNGKEGKNEGGNGTRFLSCLPRTYIYVVGGITHSEICATYEAITQFNREIIIVGPDIITPTTMTEYLMKENDE